MLHCAAGRCCGVVRSGSSTINAHSLLHAVLSYKGFAERPKGETQAAWEGDSAEKTTVEMAQFRSGRRESEIGRGGPVRPHRTQAAARLRRLPLHLPAGAAQT